VAGLVSARGAAGYINKDVHLTQVKMDNRHIELKDEEGMHRTDAAGSTRMDAVELMESNGKELAASTDYNRVKHCDNL
jgi:hypothetical protein